MGFRLTSDPIVPPVLDQDRAGGYVTFDGRVRNHNEGKPVLRLEYEAFGSLAQAEGGRILAEATTMFGLLDAVCIHRTGLLEIGESAVWIGVAAAHRGEAFKACEFIIDELKKRVPIWKKEHYADGPSEWIGVQPASDAGDYYRRQTILAEVGEAGQEKLGSARVLVVGAGGLGSAVLPYLAAAGIGRIGICDGDQVEVSNLHRQVLFEVADRGEDKATLAAERMRRLNPHITVDVVAGPLTSANASEVLEDYDVVVDGTDNFAAKFLLNQVCVQAGKVLVQASLHQFEGQLLVVDPASEGGCLRCLWRDAPYDGCVGTCAEAGVLGVVPGVFGVLQANEVIKIALGLPGVLRTHLLTVDLRSYDVLKLKRSRREDCECCGTGDPSAAIEIDWGRAAGMRIVDIRELGEEGNVPGAERMPRGHLGRISEGPVCLVCQRGGRSGAAARELRSRGIEAYSLARGIDGLRLI